MKKFIILALMATVVALPVAGYTQQGASDTAMEKAGPQAVFHRFGDWFATIGKSDAEKQKIIAERKAERAKKRMMHEGEKAQKKAKEKSKEMNKEMHKKKKEMGEKMKGM